MITIDFVGVMLDRHLKIQPAGLLSAIKRNIEQLYITANITVPVYSAAELRMLDSNAV